MILLSNIIKAQYVVFDDKNMSRIIKTEPEPKVINTPREDLYEIYNQREVILKEANEEAMKIINAAKRNAQSEIAELKKKGYEEGFNAGMEIGKNKGYEEGLLTGRNKASDEINKQNQSRLKEISEMIAEIENEKEAIISKYENGIGNLSIEIAEKIIRQKIDSN